MAPPWGVGWRKCDTCGYSRGSLAIPSMFPEAFGKPLKKTLIFGCLFASILAPFGILIGYIWGSFFPTVFGHIHDAFFFEICGISDPANPQFWCSRLGAVRFFEFSSNCKQIQNERKISPNLLPKSTKKPPKIKSKIN